MFWGPEELFTKYSYVSNYIDKDIWTVYSNSYMNCIKKIIVSLQYQLQNDNRE